MNFLLTQHLAHQLKVRSDTLSLVCACSLEARLSGCSVNLDYEGI